MLAYLFSTYIFAFFPNTVPAQSTAQLTVYYESMCPDSDIFFHQQLAPTYEKLSSYLDVDIVPYGNAKWSGKPDQYKFQCQHGPDECYGNTVQACFVTLVNNTVEQIKFINCAFTLGVQRRTLEKCIDNIDLRRQVKKCVTGPMGNNILHEMGKKTDDLNPPHTFIPWITINGRGGVSLNDRANTHLMKVICDEFLTDKPAECNNLKQTILKQFRRHYL